MTGTTPPPTPLVTTITRYGGVCIALFQGIALPALDRPVVPAVIALAAAMMAVGEAYRLDIRRRNGDDK